MLPTVSYRNLNLLADEGRWRDLLELAAAADVATAEERREVAHVVALEAPAKIAAAVLDEFADDDEGYLGPLWEVVAHRPWRELSPHLRNPRIRHLVAHTRVLRGEDLRSAPDLDPELLGAPSCLQPWEATRWDIELDVPGYGRSSAGGTTLPIFPARLVDPRPFPFPFPAAAVRPGRHGALPTLAGLSRMTRAYTFHGTAWEAASAVAAHRVVRRGAQFSFAAAYPSLVHLATGVLADARGTGQALGRAAVWRALAAMAGSTRPAGPEPIGALVERLRCVGWREPRDRLLYVHLAMEDPEQGLTWVLDGQDGY